MGKASSSKKVARAARAAGRPGARRSYLWPFAIGSVVVLGIAGIVASRGSNEDAVAPILGDHWHAAYGIYDCDSFIPPLNDVVQDQSGIHTHADGLIHMHPFSTRYTGAGSNINAWGETTGLVLTDTSIKAQGIDRENGDSCGDEKGTVKLMVWDGPDDEEGTLIEEDLGSYAPQEFEVLTIAFVAEGTEIPKPPQEYLENLKAPADVVGGEPQIPSSTVPVEGSSTTVPEGTTTTAATDESTTTTTAGATSTTAP